MSEPSPVATSRMLRFWRHPIAQMIVRLVVFIVLMIALGYLLRWLLPLPARPANLSGELGQSATSAWLRLGRSVLAIGGAYWLMVRLLERRPLSELSVRKLPRHALGGWLIGTGIMAASALALAAVGSYSVHGLNPDAPMLVPLIVLGLGAGITEEIIARGILFRVVEEGLGTWVALVFSAALFGAGHLANPNATWWSSLAIAIEAGLLLGMAYAWTRSLWFVMALHAAWNFTQGPLLGISVSGIAVTGLVDSSTQGPPILSGGEFGAEASILALAICVAIAWWFTRRAREAGRIVPPFWKRRLPDGSVPPLRFPEPEPK